MEELVMQQTALPNNKRGKDSRQAGMTLKGLSLVEVMISLVILLLVFLALMQTALVSIDSNIRNLLRDEASSIAEQRMTALRNTRFDDLTAGTVVEGGIPRQFREMSVTFTPTRTITDPDADNKQITVRIDWNWKGDPFVYTINSIKRKIW